MDFILRLWQFYFVIVAGWINRQRQELVGSITTRLLSPQSAVSCAAGRTSATIKSYVENPGRHCPYKTNSYTIQIQ